MPASSPDLGGPSARAVYRDLLRFGAPSRKDLVSKLDLSAPTITRATRDLIGAGLVHTLGPVAGAKGRPQEPLDVEENSGPRFIGVKVTADDVHAVVTTVRGNVVEEMTFDLPGTAPEQVVEAVTEPAADLAAAHPGVIGIGLSLGGRTAHRRTVLSSNMLDWNEPVDLADRLEARLHLPVAIENDLVAMLNGLHWFGIGRAYHSFVLITVGAGVGLGTVHADRVVTGTSRVAGLTELLPVGTGADGSIVTLGEAARTDRLLARARAAGILPADDGLGRLRALLAEGDAGASELAADLARSLARAAAVAVALLDPQAIVLGGENLDLVRAAGSTFKQTLRVAVAPAQRDVVVRMLREEFDEWARGAAIIAIQEFVGTAL